MAEEDFTRFGASVFNQSEVANSQLVDDILKTLNAPGFMPDNASTYPPPSLAEIPARIMSPALPPQTAQQLLLQDQLSAANNKIRLLEEQVMQERERAAALTETQTNSINSLMEQQHKSGQLVSELRQFILTQSEEMRALRDGDAQSEERRRAMDEYTEQTSAALRNLNADLLAIRRERDSVREELENVLKDLNDSRRETELLQESLQSAKRELDAIKKVENDMNSRLAEQGKASQEREDQMKKKAESLAKEVVRLRAELKRSGDNAAAGLEKDREQNLLSIIAKLREENKELRDIAQSNEARNIGLHDTSVRARLSDSPNISSIMPDSPQATPMPDLKSPVSQPSESPQVVREVKRSVRSAAPPGSPQAQQPVTSFASKAELLEAYQAGAPSVASLPVATPPATLSSARTSPGSGPEGGMVPARLDLELDLPFNEATQDREAFELQLRLDIAAALQGNVAKIKVLKLQPGSVVATLEVYAGFTSDGRSPLQIARQLVVEARNPGSALRKGRITSFATKVRSIEQDMDAATEAVVVSISVGKGRNVPVCEGMSKSFVVVRVNDINLGITEEQSGPDPIFMQDFKGQVRVNPGALISLSFHQRKDNGVDILTGYVAVPLHRVLESGREEGWYDLRSHNDTLVKGVTGIAEILVNLSATMLNPATNEPRDLTSSERLSLAILRPRGLLEVLIGRTSNINAVAGEPGFSSGKLACVVCVGAQSRKTLGCFPEPDAVWEQGFQVPIYAPESDSVQIEVVEEPLDGMDPHGNRFKVSRFYGSCTLQVSQIISQLQVSGLEATASWHLLQDGDSGAESVGSKGSSQLQVAFAWRLPPTDSESTDLVSGWLRLRDRKASLFFVLDPYSQTLLGYSEEREALREKPIVEFEVRGCQITSVNSTADGGEVTFDLWYDQIGSASTLQLSVSNQVEWERWFNVLHRTSRANELKPGVFATVLVPPNRAPPKAPTTPEPPPSPELTQVQITKPDYLIEVNILRGRKFALDGEDSKTLQTAVVVQFARQAYSTLASWPTTSPVWNESLQLVCSESGLEELITLIVWGWRRPAEEQLQSSEKIFIGHIAVPASRVKGVGQEEGWYDLRDKNGNLISGPEGTAAALVSFTVTPAAKLPHDVQDFIFSRTEDQDDMFANRYHVLDPYAQRLVIYSRLPLAGISEGEIHRSWNIRGCHVEVEAKAAVALESILDTDPARYQVSKSCPFVVHTVQGRLVCCAESAESCRMWAQALERLGNPDSMRKLDASLRTTGPVLWKGARIQVVVERARNLRVSSLKKTSSYFCVVQLRESQFMTAVANESDIPKWSESFEIPVTDADSDLVTVQLLQEMEAGNMEETAALGHVAVPVARVRATGTEEGWYELRARDGEFIMGDKGKATLLVRFRYSGPGV